MTPMQSAVSADDKTPTSADDFLTAQERAILRAARNLRDLRNAVMVESLANAHRQLDQMALAEVAARQLYENSLLLETESDDWDVAKAALEKFERIEFDFVQSHMFTLDAVRRLQWELREAKKTGIIS